MAQILKQQALNRVPLYPNCLVNLMETGKPNQSIYLAISK